MNTKRHFNRFINPSEYPHRNKDFWTNNKAETLINNPNHVDHEVNIQVYTEFCNKYSTPLESLLEYIDFKQNEVFDKNKDYNQEKCNPVALLYYRILVYYKHLKYFKLKPSYHICLDHHLHYMYILYSAINRLVENPDFNYNDIPYMVI